jgi:hypothetical protein
MKMKVAASLFVICILGYISLGYASGSSTTNPEPHGALSDLTYNLLFKYDPSDYDLQLHPYTVSDNNDITLGEMGVVWDLTGDAKVDLQDFSILSQLDMAQLIEDVNGLQGTFTNEYLNAILLNIMGIEKELGISDLKLFKVLFFEAGFDVSVYEYESDHMFFKLHWENETQAGWIDMQFFFWHGLRFEYEYTYRFWTKE